MNHGECFLKQDSSQADIEGRRVSYLRNLEWQSLEGSLLEACPARAKII